MDVKALEYLLKVEEYGNISKAAEKLHISASGLNQTISRLERELGLSIFKRENKRWVPTEAGDKYLEGAREMVRIKENTYERIRSISDYNKNVLRIAICSQAFIAHGDEILSGIRESLQKAGNALLPKLEISEADSETAAEYLKNHIVDAAIICSDTQHNPYMKLYPLYSEELMLAVPDVMAWAGTKIDYDAFSQLPLVYTAKGDLHRRTQRMLREKNLIFNNVFTADDCRGLLLMAEHGYGAALLPKGVIREIKDCRCYRWDPPEEYKLMLAVLPHRGNKLLIDSVLAIRDKIS